MKIGTVVTYSSRNPNREEKIVGVVVPGGSDHGASHVLVAEGVLTVEDARNSDCHIASLPVSDLTPVAPSIADQLAK